MLFDNFSQDDWNDFYNFGFECVQDYLKNGLVQADTSDYFLKALRLKVEGVEGDGTVTSWMNDWIINRREEITEEDLYSQFSDEHPIESYSWDSKRFHKGFYDFVSEHPDYGYNEHLSHKGDKKSDRRHLVGKRGQQKPQIVITVKGEKGHNVPSDSTIEYFKELGEVA